MTNKEQLKNTVKKTLVDIVKTLDVILEAPDVLNTDQENSLAIASNLILQIKEEINND